MTANTIKRHLPYRILGAAGAVLVAAGLMLAPAPSAKAESHCWVIGIDRSGHDKLSVKAYVRNYYEVERKRARIHLGGRPFGEIEQWCRFDSGRWTCRYWRKFCSQT